MNVSNRGWRSSIGRLGAIFADVLRGVGQGGRFFWRIVMRSPAAWRRPRLVIEQIHFIGNYSLSIIGISGLFVGFVLGLQAHYILSTFGSSQMVGLFTGLALLRELGPVVTALLFAGRAGTSITAEIGLMRAGEQLSAMEMMAVDPVTRVVVPRFWAGVIAMPLLATIFSAVGVIGGYVGGAGAGFHFDGNHVFLSGVNHATKKHRFPGRSVRGARFRGAVVSVTKSGQPRLFQYGRQLSGAGQV